MLAKVLSVIFGFIICMIVGILVMMYGWGLEPKSYWWIIGGGVFVQIIIKILTVMAKEKVE